MRAFGSRPTVRFVGLVRARRIITRNNNNIADASEARVGWLDEGRFCCYMNTMLA